MTTYEEEALRPDGAPRTRAGRALHDHLREVHEAGYIGGTTWDRIDRGILAIEAEAWKDARTEGYWQGVHDGQHAGLDVERLAAALHGHAVDHRDVLPCNEACAPDIAARLTTEGEKP